MGSCKNRASPGLLRGSEALSRNAGVSPERGTRGGCPQMTRSDWKHVPGDPHARPPRDTTSTSPEAFGLQSVLSHSKQPA